MPFHPRDPEENQRWLLDLEDVPETVLHNLIIELLKMVLKHRYAQKDALIASNLACRWNAKNERAGALKLAKVDLLIVDDWAIAPVQETERQDILEVLEDRHELRSTLLAGQLPPEQWHAYLEEATLADAICDRVLHAAHRFSLKGPSKRKEKAPTK